MNNIDLLKSIISEAQEALDSGCAGGAEEYAFDLTADHKELTTAHDHIFDLNTRIMAEMNPGSGD